MSKLFFPEMKLFQLLISIEGGFVIVLSAKFKRLISI
jgi:hypothetical protein